MPFAATQIHQRKQKGCLLDKDDALLAMVLIDLVKQFHQPRSLSSQRRKDTNLKRGHSVIRKLLENALRFGHLLADTRQHPLKCLVLGAEFCTHFLCVEGKIRRAHERAGRKERDSEN